MRGGMEGQESDLDLFGGSEGMNDIISELGLADEFKFKEEGMSELPGLNFDMGCPSISGRGGAGEKRQREEEEEEAPTGSGASSAFCIKQEHVEQDMDRETARTIMSMSSESDQKDSSAHSSPQKVFAKYLGGEETTPPRVGAHSSSYGASGSGDQGLPTPPSTTRRTDKGLRSFSLKVCQKVEERGVTTYAEVADELVQEFQNEETCAFDEKNIRRRVYDALNVLMAIDIITKDKKRIRWKGFPQSTHKEREGLQRQAEEKRRLLDEKTRLLEEKAVQMIKISNLVERNSRVGGEEAASEKRRVGIPFVIVKASTDNTIECEISEDRKDALLTFSKSFELRDDVAVLEELDLSTVESEDELRRKLNDTGDFSSMLLLQRPNLIRGRQRK